LDTPLANRQSENVGIAKKAAIDPFRALILKLSGNSRSQSRSGMTGKTAAARIEAPFSSY
jgi:hypothetical protein